MTTKLDIQEKQIDDVLVINLVGSLDGHTYMKLDDFLKTKIAANINSMVIVLKEVSYIASAGVGVLISYMRQCQGAAGTLEVAEPSPSVNEVLEILGLDALMTLHRDIKLAVAAAKKSAH